MNKKQPGNTNSILKFVDEYVDSFISWDILIFFHNNPAAIETARSLSGRLGRRLDDTKDGLSFLCDKGVLRNKDDETFEFKPEEKLAKQITAFGNALAEREMRMKILSKVLSKGKVR